MDEDLRALERAAAADPASRLALQRELVRARRPLDAAWSAFDLVADPGLFAAASRIPEARARFDEDLGALCPLRLRAHYPLGAHGAPVEAVTLASYAATGSWRPLRLVARRAGARLQIALDEEPSAELEPWGWDARASAVVTALAVRAGLAAAGTSDGDVRLGDEVVARGQGPALALAFTGAGLVAVLRDSVLLGGRRLEPGLPRIETAAVSPAGDALAMSDGEALLVLDLPGGGLRWRVEHARYAERADVSTLRGLAFSPDGALLAQAGGAVVVRTAAAGAPHGVPVLDGRRTNEWSDNSSTMGLGRDEGRDESYPAATAAAWVGPGRLATLGPSWLRLWTLGPHAQPGPSRWHYGEDTSSRVTHHQTFDAEAEARPGLLAASPDGRLLAARASATEVRAFRVEGGLTRLATFPVSGRAAAFSGDGRRLVVGDAVGAVTSFDLPG